MSIAHVLKSVPAQMLPSITGCLKKAQAWAAERNIPESVLLNDRLAPDMFPLVRQVQVATDMLARGTARLAGVDFLSLPDTETTFDELYARIAKVAEFVEQASSEAIDSRADEILQIPMGPETRPFPGRDYLLGFVLPNFYFHLSMTYAILRHNGVPLGKRDFLAAS